MNNSNFGNNDKDDAIKSVFTNNNRPQTDNTDTSDDQKERIEYRPSRPMTEAEEFFGPQRHNRSDSPDRSNSNIKSLSTDTLQAQAEGKVDGQKTPESTEEDNSKIEVEHYNLPIKQSIHDYDDTESQSQSNQNQSFKPIKIPDQNHSVGIAATVAIIVLSLGFGGGYFGYNLATSFLKNQTASADEETITLKPSPSISAVVSPSPSPSVSSTASALENWSVYKNTKYNYSLKFPDTWFGQGTNNEQSASVQLTSFKPNTSGSEIQNGYKVEVMFQDSKGKLLEDWIKANNAVLGVNSKLTELKIDGKDAYQQTVDSVGKSINTYVFQADKVMVISYYASESDFEKGKTNYQNIIESINLL